MDLEKLYYVIFGGIITIGGRWLIELIRDKRKGRTIEDNIGGKVVESKILKKLLPGTTISNMKELLGEPLKHHLEDWSILKKGANEDVKTNSYIYVLKNAALKITTKDNLKIDTLTIIPAFKKKINISDITLFKIKLGKTKFTKEITDLANKYGGYQSVRQFVKCLRISIPNPIYKNFTFFFYDGETHIKGDYSKLIGATIDGVCITNMGDDEDSFYIFDYELR